MKYDSAFQCGTCQTVVRFDAEHPVPWYELEYLVELRERAKAWVERNPEGMPYNPFWFGPPKDATEEEREGHEVKMFLRSAGYDRLRGFDDRVDIRRFDCPTCGSLVGIKDAVEPLSSADEIADKVLEKMHEKAKREPWRAP